MQLFARANLSYADVLRHIGPPDSTAPRIGTAVEIPFTEQTKQALHYAAEEADRLRHGHIGTEHLLLALLRVQGSVAASILERHGMSIDAERDAILELDNLKRG
jgi:ATP-dependent Clp protease ATP-binding subunit ClpC